MKEPLIYGSRHNSIVILEGIMYSDWYKPLFELAVQLYGTGIYAYYFDNCHSFGEKEMRRWWREKDFSGVLDEVSVTDGEDMESIVTNIYNTILNG